MKPEPRKGAMGATGGGRVLVLPNSYTVGLLILLFAMWYAGASQNNQAAFLLCFVIFSVALVSTMHAWVNLRGVQVKSGVISPVFVGENMIVPLHASTHSTRGHYGIRASYALEKSNYVIGDVSAENPARGDLSISALNRGFYPGLEIELSSFYPLGFFTARKTVSIQQEFYIYPKPEGKRPLPASLTEGNERQGILAQGDDFAGVRAYRRGESQRHIDWKAVARNQPMQVKQWAGESDQTLSLDWQELKGLDAEVRLSQLAAWVLQAENRGARYGLALPGLEIQISSGEQHQQECLQALALFRFTPEPA